MAIFNYTFDTPLMRYLYSKNKTDKALELFLAEVSLFEPIIFVIYLVLYFVQKENNIFKTSTRAGIMLMNKLLLEKRYNDVLNVFKKLIKSYEASKQLKDKPFVLFSSSSIWLASQALLKLVSFSQDWHF